MEKKSLCEETPYKWSWGSNAHLLFMVYSLEAFHFELGA